MDRLDENAALLIIDLQKGIQDPKTGRRNNPDAERQVEALLNAWRTTHRPVVHVRHISRSPQSVFWPGQPGCEFQDAFQPLADEHVIEKNVPDAFAASGLERWLLVRSIRQVVIVGVATNNSVESTARTGGNLGFDVVVVADATYTFDLIDLTGRPWRAEDVHVLSLSNLAIDYARVVEAADLLIAV
ncbi:Peroxyureidoacrylate/ureidoacrylate amidohydrolase RutB [Pseudomonas fluorescens]|uniref:cysteine hydrolase family protein n=1 Tax=Pseudomonas fluorescens TaxID=294 RepID=UPI00125558E2|nr:cysteine hydrolase family protein [Pseudomonas fluorescens]CAG8867861.1 Peroxyureidoacrylate/ureidoacrylate amidohydrolase RutB [Pseudomonas fluorescens]